MENQKDKNDIRNIVPTISSSQSFPTIETLELKRGTGGRSSFSGIVATVFGAGQLGRCVITSLARAGAQIIVPYRGDPIRVRSIKLCGDLGQILFVPFHLRDDISLKKAMKYSTVVVNCIGSHKDTPNFTMEEAHIEGCARVAKLARETGIKRFIHVSALNCSPNPPATYVKGGSRFLRTKYHGEQAVRNEFPDATIIRPAELYGAYQWAAYWAYFWRRHYKRLYLTNRGKGVFKLPVDQRDVAEGIASAVSDSTTIGRVIEAYGPAKHEFHDMVRWTQDVLQLSPAYSYRPIGDLKYRPGMLIRARLLGNFVYPPISLEKLELETITDMPDPAHLNLYHLGVEPGKLEDRGKESLIPFSQYSQVNPLLGELPKPEPIPVYPIYYPNDDE